MGFRETMNNKPWIGYVLVAALGAGAVLGYMRLSGSGDPNGVEQLTQIVTIRDSETGDEWKMSRGQMELELIQRSAKATLEARSGLINPKTGKPNGFPVDRSWDEAITRINAERAAANASRPKATDTPAPKGN